jgi:hypothetical protein
MQFIQNPEDGSCRIKFSWRERVILFFKGRILMDTQSFRHFSNNLVRMVAEWTKNFEPEVQKMHTTEDDPIQTK